MRVLQLHRLRVRHRRGYGRTFASRQTRLLLAGVLQLSSCSLLLLGLLSTAARRGRRTGGGRRGGRGGQRSDRGGCAGVAQSSTVVADRRTVRDLGYRIFGFHRSRRYGDAVLVVTVQVDLLVAVVVGIRLARRRGRWLHWRLHRLRWLPVVRGRLQIGRRLRLLLFVTMMVLRDDHLAFVQHFLLTVRFEKDTVVGVQHHQTGYPLGEEWP